MLSGPSTLLPGRAGALSEVMSTVRGGPSCCQVQPTSNDTQLATPSFCAARKGIETERSADVAGLWPCRTLAVAARQIVCLGSLACKSATWSNPTFGHQKGAVRSTRASACKVAEFLREA